MGEKVPKDIKIEDVLEAAGGFGIYQKVFSFLTIFPQLTAAMIVLSPVFTGTDKVPLYCTNETRYDVSTCGLNCTISDGSQVHQSIVQEWDLVCSRGWIADTITSCQMAGMMIGSMFSSLLADKFGRIKGFLFITLGMGIFGMLPSIAWDPISYAVGRFLAGVGMGGCFVVYLVHLMEFLTPKYRIICGAVSLWPIGEMLLALSAYMVPNWRILTVITAFSTLLILLFYPFIQESPRWLLTRRRTREAHEILRKVARWNNAECPTYATVEALQDNVLKEEADVVKGFEGFKQIVKNAELRLHLIILLWANITCSVVYYGVSFSAKALSGSPYWNMVYMGGLDLLAVPAVFLFSNRLGRCRTFLLYMSFASIFLLAILGLDFTQTLAKSDPMLVTVFSLLGRFGVVSSWSCLTLIILESFPTTLRSSCLGLCALAGYLAGLVAPQMTQLGKVSESLPYMVYCFLTVSTAVSSWFLREMAGSPLADTINNDPKK